MTFVAAHGNTNVVARAATITDVVDPHERLVAFIRELMASGVSQQAIADRTGGEVSQSAISSYVSGTRRAKLDSAIAIGRAFGKPLDYFTSESSVERVDAHPVLEDFIAEQRLDQAEADDLRSQARAWGGRFVRDELLLLLPAVRARAARLRAEAAGEAEPKELPPVPVGRRRVPPGKKGRT